MGKAGTVDIPSPADIGEAVEARPPAVVGAGCPSAGAGVDAGVGVSSKHPATSIAASTNPAKNGSFITLTNWASYQQTCCSNFEGLGGNPEYAIFQKEYNRFSCVAELEDGPCLIGIDRYCLGANGAGQL